MDKRIERESAVFEQGEKEQGEAFRQDFLEKMGQGDRMLNTFLKENFFATNEEERKQIQMNCTYLEALDDYDKRISKAKLKQFEQSNDISKYFPVIIALITVMVGLLAILSKSVIKSSEVMPLVIFGVEFLGVIAFICIIVKLIRDSKQNRDTGIYINSLLEYVFKEK